MVKSLINLQALVFVVSGMRIFNVRAVSVSCLFERTVNNFSWAFSSIDCIFSSDELSIGFAGLPFSDGMQIFSLIFLVKLRINDFFCLPDIPEILTMGYIFGTFGFCTILAVCGNGFFFACICTES